MEDDNVIESIEELGSEMLLDFIDDFLLDARLQLAGLLVDALEQVIGTEIARHDDDRVGEIDRATLAICNRPADRMSHMSVRNRQVQNTEEKRSVPVNRPSSSTCKSTFQTC